MTAATTTHEAAHENLGFIECWNQILTPKWIRFRHLLSGNGQIHSERAAPLFDVRPGERILDVGCGMGETCLQLGARVGQGGEVLGLDCTEAFLEIGRREAAQAGLRNVRFEVGDAQLHPLPAAHFDLVYSRFGVMFFESAVRALRNAHGALRPDGRLCLIVWRSLAENPAWNLGKQVVRQFLPEPEALAATCGPGPFSMAHEATTRAMLGAAGFDDVERFERIDAEICVGRDLAEAVDFQLLVGPSGELVREAGELGQRHLPAIRRALEAALAPHVRADGGVYLASSTWAIVARKAGVHARSSATAR
jgi:SAM-dependent methyltransferase